MFRGGGSGAMSGKVSAVSPEDAVEVPPYVNKGARVEREWFQFSEGRDPEERVVVYSEADHVLFNGTVEGFEELCRIVSGFTF